MKQFDFYEFTGILLPGALLLAGVVLIWPDAARVDGFKDLSVGGFGMFVLLAYVTRHLVQALGNLIEWIWWQVFGGMPTDWVRSGKHGLLAQAQMSKLHQLVVERLGISMSEKLSDLDVGSWYAITRQIHAAVAAAGRANRIETFNGNYGLNRGLLSAALAIGALAVASGKITNLGSGLIGVLAGLAAIRMHRFAKHYARELFVQFLQLPFGDAAKEKKQ